MSQTLKQANRGCFLLAVAIIASVLVVAGAFFIFALGMGGGSSALSAAEHASANTMFIALIIGVPILCLVAPILGIWGMLLVIISTYNEIREDLRLQNSEGEVQLPYVTSFARISQAIAIGLAIYIFFELVASGLAGAASGDTFLSLVYGSSMTLVLTVMPLIILLGSIVGGLLYARWKGRQTATALGAIIGGTSMGIVTLLGLIVYIIIAGLALKT